MFVSAVGMWAASGGVLLLVWWQNTISRLVVQDLKHWCQHIVDNAYPSNVCLAPFPTLQLGTGSSCHSAA